MGLYWRRDMNRNAAKKIGKRGAGTWGRQGTPKEKRAASKAVRKAELLRARNGAAGSYANSLIS